MRAEWSATCSCVLGQRMEDGQRPIFFADEAEATEYWLRMRTGGDVFYACHARGRGHLLTVHIPQVCACSACSPEFYR